LAHRRLVRFWLLLILLVCHPETGRTQDQTPAIADLTRQLGLTGVDLGYLLVDLTSGRVIDAHAPDQAFLPGSVIKLATSLVAWRELGADFHFTTRLWHVDDDLYLQGSGDPVLAATDLKVLIQQLHQLQPTRHWRRFYIDATALPAAIEISDQQPMAADYNPGFGALNVNFNRLALDWSGTAGSMPAPRFQVSSRADGLPLTVDWLRLDPGSGPLPPGAPFTLGNAGSATAPEAWRYDPDLQHAGLPDSGRLFLPVKQANLATALVFRALAAQDGIDLPAPQPAAVPQGAMPVAGHDSPPFPALLQGLMRYSNNLSAEMLGLVTASRLNGRPTDLATAARQHAGWLAAELTGTDWRSFRMINHSGLDGGNRATPRQIVRILQEMAADPALAASIPVLQMTADGALQQLDDGQQSAAGVSNGTRIVIRGKSGTMNAAAGLAGLVTTPVGRRFAYAIFVVDTEARAKLEAAFDPRILKRDANTRHWTQQARLLEAALIRRWFPALH
jgi:D-alanyl-D-alanine carboxypeptidase/D-alanyl-D-alanine-endopeptidase (penicillin-binding protein 4)